jgi:hypothetical protein
MPTLRMNLNERTQYYNIEGGKSIIFSEVQFIQSTEGKIHSTEGKMSILSISMYRVSNKY